MNGYRPEHFPTGEGERGTEARVGHIDRGVSDRSAYDPARMAWIRSGSGTCQLARKSVFFRQPLALANSFAIISEGIR